MRLALVLVILATSAFGARAAEDRYGPSATGGPGAPATPPYAGPLLGWAGKTAPSARRPVETSAPARPAPMPGGLYRATPPQAAPTMAPTAASAAPARYATPPAAPQSLYGGPAPQSVRAPPPPPPSATAVQGGLYAAAGPRFYSVHRPYGEAPDPIPTPPTGDRLAFRPEASLAGAVALSGVGDGVRKDDADDGGMAGVGVEDGAEEAERAARREADRAAARRAAAGSGQ